MTDMELSTLQYKAEKEGYSVFKESYDNLLLMKGNASYGSVCRIQGQGINLMHAAYADLPFEERIVVALWLLTFCETNAIGMHDYNELDT